MQPNVSIPNKISHYAQSDTLISDLHEKHLMKQQQFFADKKEKELDKKNKKSKKEKSKKTIREDRILVHPGKEPAQRFNVPPHHEYQNLLEEHEKLLQLGEHKFMESRKFGDTGKLNEKKTRCAIQDGVYVFHNTNGSSRGSSLTSFAELENKKSTHEIDVNSSGKLKHFNLSKYLNIDVKSASPIDIPAADKSGSDKQDSSSKSSSLSNKSIDSMEQAIIMNGIKNSDNQTNSYLGPFNFRKLLRPTGIAPTESLRKRKMVILNTSSPPPDKNLRTNGLL